MKNYMKPSISFQFFNLTANASGGCSIESNQAEYECKVGIPDWPGEYLIGDSAPCTVDGDPEDFGICYNVPVGDARVLGS